MVLYSVHYIAVNEAISLDENYYKTPYYTAIQYTALYVLHSTHYTREHHTAAHPTTPSPRTPYSPLYYTNLYYIMSLGHCVRARALYTSTCVYAGMYDARMYVCMYVCVSLYESVCMQPRPRSSTSTHVWQYLYMFMRAHGTHVYTDVSACVQYACTWTYACAASLPSGTPGAPSTTALVDVPPLAT